MILVTSVIQKFSSAKIKIFYSTLFSIISGSLNYRYKTYGLFLINVKFSTTEIRFFHRKFLLLYCHPLFGSVSQVEYSDPWNCQCVVIVISGMKKIQEFKHGMFFRKMCREETFYLVCTTYSTIFLRNDKCPDEVYYNFLHIG